MPSPRVKELIEKVTTEPDFLDAVIANPHDALTNSGLDLTTDEITGLADLDWSNDDQQLHDRIAKRIYTRS